MEKAKIYVVTCRRGLDRSNCPLVLQQGAHCVECPNVVYVPRVRKEQPDKQEGENENVES